MASELEKQMAELMKGTGDILKGTKEAQQTASKVRRKSRDLQQILQDLPQAEQWKGLVDLLGSDTSDDAIAKLFDEIDTDSSGTIEKKELTAKFIAMGKDQDKKLLDSTVEANVEKIYSESQKAKIIKDSEKIEKAEFMAMMKSQISAAAAAPA